MSDDDSNWWEPMFPDQLMEQHDLDLEFWDNLQSDNSSDQGCPSSISSEDLSDPLRPVDHAFEGMSITPYNMNKPLPLTEPSDIEEPIFTYIPVFDSELWREQWLRVILQRKAVFSLLPTADIVIFGKRPETTVLFTECLYSTYLYFKHFHVRHYHDSD